MSRNRTVIPKATVARILSNAGAKRISDDAVDTFTEVLTELATKISTKAIDMAKHSGRKTVNDKDIKLAAKTH
tara:strand:+ start:4003 stop:4221 length:219 start_codon:yes stop_codon:yes gene_type:complete